MKIKLTNDYNSLEMIKKFLETKTELEVSIVQDQWATDGELILTAGKNVFL